MSQAYNAAPLPPPMAGMATINVEDTLPESPVFERQSKLCAKCKFFSNGVFLPPTAVTSVQNAELLVVTDGPDKRAVRGGQYFAGEAGEMFFDALAAATNIANAGNTVVLPAVRCMPTSSSQVAKATRRKGTNATTTEATKCWKASGLADLIPAYCSPAFQRTTGTKKKRILLLGYWPTKLVADKFLVEVRGQVMEIGDAIVGVLEAPSMFYTKHVRWRKDDDGRWYTDPPNGYELAHAEWMAHARFVLGRLFSEDTASVVTLNSDTNIQFPHVVVNSPEEFVRRIEEREGKLCHLDVETYATEEQKALGRTALDWFYGPDCCRPLCMGLAFFDTLKDIKYDPYSSKPDYDPNMVPIYEGEWHEDIARALNKTKLYAFNAPYDTGTLYQHTGVLCDIYADPCDMAYVANQGRKKYALASLALEYVPNYAGWGDDIKGSKDYSLIERSKLLNYNAGDNVVSSVLYFKLLEELAAIGANYAYWSILGPAKGILRDMEARGWCVDMAYWREIAQKVTEARDSAEQSLRDLDVIKAFNERRKFNVALLSGGKDTAFNPRSDAQVKEILQTIRGEVVPSSGKEILKKWAKEGCEFSKRLLAYREEEKRFGIYVKTFSEKMDADYFGNSIVYAAYKTNTTETGRTSSGGSDVVGLGKTNQINVQNVPRGGGMRRLFVPRPGMKFAYADYSQIEVRVAGAYARSPEIVAACYGEDFHGTVASRVFGIPIDEIMAEDKYVGEHGGTSKRTQAKSITFGLIYGMQAEGLALKLGVTVKEAEKFIADYFAGMPAVGDFIARTHAFAAKNLYVQTVFGRRRKFVRYNSATERESVNTLVQSTASDIFLSGLLAVKAEFSRDNSYNRFFFPCGEIHDANINEFFCCAMPEKEVAERVEYAMTNLVRKMFPLIDEFLWEVPLAVDVKILDALH